jgi:probable HAF family extracellular repeat protein
MKRSIGPAMLVNAFVAIALTGFATLAAAQTASAPPPHYANAPHYTVINLGTLGNSQGYGSYSFGSGVTNNGWVNGDSDLPGNVNEHAVLWRPDGMGQYKITDLGTLGGLNSASAWPSSSKNNHGLVVGQAQSSQIDPLQEYWGVDIGCGSGSCNGYQNLQLGFVWQNGVMTALPTLGGNNGEATGVNNRGQVVGFAETATRDSSCVPPQLLDINAAVWGPNGGEVHALRPYGTDVLSAAAGINDNDDVVGASGTCEIIENSAPAVHAVVWRNGQVFNLPGLGGVMNNVALAINNAGQIAGESDPQGDATTYAVLWQNGRMTNLGVLSGDVLSVANDINAQGQVVGVSCDADGNCRAFLWDKGVMMDLNSLIPPDSPLYLTYASGINDRGEIAGYAVLKSNTNEQPGFLAIPAPAAQIAGDSAQKMILPENVRASLQRRLRLGRPTTQQ